MSASLARSSQAQTQAAPRYTPLAHAALEMNLNPITLTVLLGILAEFAHRKLPVMDILTSGRQPFLVDESIVALQDLIGSRCGLTGRTVKREIDELVRLGFVEKFKSACRLEITPAMFGWPSNLHELKRLARDKKLKRRYVPFPLALVGRYTPAETATLVQLLAAGGVGLFTRFLEGNHVTVEVLKPEIATAAGLNKRSVQRALDRLEEDGLLSRTSLNRGGVAVRLAPAILGIPPEPEPEPEPATILSQLPPIEIKKEDIVADSADLASFVHVREEKKPREVAQGAQLRAAFFAHHRVLQALCAPGGSTSPGVRAQLRRAALQLADAGISVEYVAVIARTLNYVSPGRIVEGVFADIRRHEQRAARAAQFQAQAHPSVAAPAVSPPHASPPPPEDPEILARRLAAVISNEFEVTALLIAKGLSTVDRRPVIDLWRVYRAQREEQEQAELAERLRQEEEARAAAEGEPCSVAEGLAILRAALITTPFPVRQDGS